MSPEKLFLFPDGAGSAISYANLPNIHSDIAVIGLNCPYVRHPQEMTCPLDELKKGCLDEVKRRQPHGPYNFGGWSVGGILAYRAIQNLIQEGEEVESLVIIDSPGPKSLDWLPQRSCDHCNTINLFGKNARFIDIIPCSLACALQSNNRSASRILCDTTQYSVDLLASHRAQCVYCPRLTSNF